MSTISPSTQEIQPVFLLSCSPDRFHLSFRLNPLRTRNDDELKHAVLNEVTKHPLTPSADTDGQQRYLMLSGKDGEKDSVNHGQDQEQFLEFLDTKPEVARAILEEHDNMPERIRVGYNSLHKSLSFVTMSTFTHDVPISWITHVIGMACFEQNLTPSELNLLEVGSTARHQGFTGNYSLSVKEPDAFITPYDRYWPTIVVESGWSETRASLEAYADLWLRGTQGQVTTVMIIKWSKIPHTKTVRGDLKVLHLISNEIRESQIENIFPRPANHTSQAVQISKSVLCGDTRPNVTDPTSNIPFPIDALRESARRAMEKDGYFPA